MAPNSVKEARRKHIADLQHGDGKYLLRNRLAATLTLPKPSLDVPPITTVPIGGYFYGDTYHVKSLNSGTTIKVEIIQQEAEETEKKDHGDPLDALVKYIDPADGQKKQRPWRDHYPEEATKILAEREKSAPKTQRLTKSKKDDDGAGNDALDL